MTAAQIAALGALLSGIGSVMSARFATKRAKTVCDEKIAAIEKSFLLGLSMSRRPDE